MRALIAIPALVWASVLLTAARVWIPMLPEHVAALGFDFDEVLMVCTGLAAIAWVITDYKRDRDLQSTMHTLHEDLGRIKTMVGWDLPHSLSERVAKLEAVAPEGIAERIAGIEERMPENAEARLSVLEDDATIERLTERISALERRANAKPRRKPAAPKLRSEDSSA